MQITNQILPNTSKYYLMLQEQHLHENFPLSVDKSQSTESDLMGDFVIQSIGFDPSSAPNVDSSRRLLIV